MSSRGEKSFVKLPNFAAKMYNKLTGTSAMDKQFDEIAAFIAEHVTDGHILDVGAGPGKLLAALHRRSPNLKLVGLDISEAMVKLAQQKLMGIPVELHQGNIVTTDFDPASFDAVTCSGSFYLWDKPVESLAEIYRILKPGHTAYLFESYRDYEKNAFEEGLKNNLRGEKWLLRKLAPRFLRRQLKMTYSLSEFNQIGSQSQFADNFTIEKITLANLPIWIRFELRKKI